MSDVRENVDPAEAGDLTEPAEVKAAIDRSRDLLGRQNSKLRRKLADVWGTIRRGFEDQSERSDAQMDYWDAYNCVLNANQYYSGEAQIYWPIIRDAVNARTTRFGNQLFPQAGRYVEAVSTDGTVPHEIVALLDHYIRARRLKTQVFKPLLRNGDIEGQYNLYVDWSEIEREIVSRETHGPMGELGGEAIELPGEDIEDISVELIADGSPCCEVLHDADVLVLPASADSVEEALAAGGVAVIVRRWSKTKIEAMIAAGQIRDVEGKALLEMMEGGRSADSGGTAPNAEKKLAELVGITAKGGEAVVWECWRMVPLGPRGDYAEDGNNRLCRIYYGPDQMALGCVRNPHWNDLCPLLSVPVEKVAGVFKGKSQVEPVISIQYEANDAVNEGADSAHYAALPIVMRNPAAGSQPLVMNIAAVWDVDPNQVKFAEFPDLNGRAVVRVQQCIQAIFQSLGVNPSMLPQQTSSARRNQAQVAQEQAVDLLTTAEAVSVVEEGIATPLMGWFVDLDYQFRDEEVQVRMFGEMGLKAAMKAVPPLQNRSRFEFRWWGVNQARNAAQYQQQIAWLNVAKEMMPALQQQGYELNVAPVLEQSAAAVFDPRTAPLVLKDIRSQLSIDAQTENELLLEGFDLPVHPLDPDQEHLQAHAQAMQQMPPTIDQMGAPVPGAGDPHGTVRAHIQRHVMQMKMKNAAMMAQQAQQQMAGRGGGRPQQPGRGGGPPRPGAMANGPQGKAKAPNGAMHPDQLPRAGGMPMPRRM